MAKKKTDKKIFKQKRETLYGMPVLKSGSARHTPPSPKPKNEMQLDYKAIAAKRPRYRNEVKTNIDFGEERFPPGSKVPPGKKYDEDGNYIKHKDVVTKGDTKNKKESPPPLSMMQMMKDHALSNPKGRGNAKKGRKK